MAETVSCLRLLHSKNEADRQPAINLQIARAYLAAGDPDVMTRTWQVVMDELIKTKQGRAGKHARPLRTLIQGARTRFVPYLRLSNQS